jgi:hypothetical protein
LVELVLVPPLSLSQPYLFLVHWTLKKIPTTKVLEKINR